MRDLQIPLFSMTTKFLCDCRDKHEVKNMLQKWVVDTLIINSEVDENLMNITDPKRWQWIMNEPQPTTPNAWRHGAC